MADADSGPAGVSQPTRRRRGWEAAAVIGSLGLGLCLVALLGTLEGFSFVRLPERIGPIRPPFLVLFGAATLAHFVLVSRKWRLVTAAIVTGDLSGVGFFRYTVLNALVSQVLPMQVSAVVVRSVAMRSRLRLPIAAGAASTAYDLLFDVAVTLVAAIVAIPAVLGMTGARETIALTVIALASSGVLMIYLHSPVMLWMLRVGRRMPGVRGWVSRMLGAGAADEETVPLLTKRVTTALVALSILRYVNLVLKNYWLALAVGLDLPFGAVALATPLVLLATVLALTPANLGISEWSWVGVLAALGVPPAAAAAYAVTKRLVMAAALLVLNALILASVTVRRVLGACRA
jgi:uncharacterized membrane protein YbhN (UPF0104 family)